MKIKGSILAIDAGFRFLAVSVWSELKECFTETHVLSTGKDNKKSVSENNRQTIEFLADRLRTIMERVKPRLVVAELPTGASRNARAVSAMSMAFSVVVLTCKLSGIRLEVIKPSEIKKKVNPSLGRKSVPKEEVIACAKKIFGSELIPTNAKAEHVADSFMALKCYLDKK